jgi:hypothetical protein
MLAACVVGSWTCTHEAAGPGPRASLAVAPVFPANLDLSSFNLTIDNVRLIVVRPPADTVYDQDEAFPLNQSSLPLTADVPLEQNPETFQVTVQLLSGTTLLFSGTQDVSVSSGSSPAPVQIPVTYSGPGKNVASLTIGPADSVLSFGGSLVFRVAAQDSQGVAVPSLYVSWTTSDTVLAPIDATGHLVAPSLRRTLTVTAKTPTSVSASTTVTFAPVATALAMVSGCNQSGLLGSQLPLPMVARVTASDGLGVPGVVVTFTAPSGASVAAPQVVTDSLGLAQTTMTLGSVSGPMVFQASAPGLTPASCSQSAFGAAAKLAFIAPPGGAIAGSAITPPVAVAVQDAQGTVVPTFTGNVTISIGTNPGNATLSGTTTVAAVAGVATFADLSLDKAATGYTLQAASSGLAGATSAAFNVAPGTANQLAFTVQPVTTPSGTAITPAVVVIAQDALGNLVPTFNANVTMSINSGPSGATLTGTPTVTPSAGVATFANLILDKVGTYTLRASASGASGATSAQFDVTVGVTRQLVFTVQPGNVGAGSAITPAVVVQAQDLQGNLDPTFTGGVKITIQTNPGGGTLFGADSVNAIAGVATFSALIIDKAGAGYALQATSTGVAPGVSSPFTVSAGVAAKLAYLVPPTNVGVGAPITPAVEVEIEDTLGNLVTTASNSVTMSIGANPSNGILAGTLTQNAANGIATFSDLTINQPGSGYTLVAGSGALVGATSGPFTVIAGATQLHVQVLPDTVNAGGTADVQVTALDGNGNVVPTYVGTISFSASDPLATLPANYTFTPTDAGTHLFAGEATFSTAPSVTLSAFDTQNSSIFGVTQVTVNPGAATKLAFTLQPVDAVQNATMPTVRVGIEDQFGNLVTNATNTVTLAIGTNPAGGVLTGGSAGTLVSGEVSFSALSISQAGSGYTLVATSSGLTSATSTPFNVLGGATKQWTGAVSSDWSTAGNWTPSGVPTSSDDVLIPSSLTTYPILSASSVVHNLIMQPGTSIETAGFALDVFGILDAPSGFVSGSGTVLLDGTGVTVQGNLPNVQSGGTVQVIGTVTVSGDLDITGGAFDLGQARSIIVTGAVTSSPGGVLVDTGGSVLTVDGDAIFGGSSEAGLLTNGTLQVTGNFTQNGDPESFRADSGFITQLLGTGLQLVTFTNPGTGAGVSHFGGLHVANTGQGVSLGSAVFADGLLLAVGSGGTQALMLGSGNTLTVQGITLDSVTIDNMPLVVTSSAQPLFAQDVTFQNDSSTATQLDITRPSGSVTFTNLKFLTAPTTGWLLQANDPVVGNGAFTITLATPSPTSSGNPRFTMTGEAVINWP